MQMLMMALSRLLGIGACSTAVLLSPQASHALTRWRRILPGSASPARVRTGRAPPSASKESAQGSACFFCGGCTILRAGPRGEPLLTCKAAPSKNPPPRPLLNKAAATFGAAGAQQVRSRCAADAQQVRTHQPQCHEGAQVNDVSKGHGGVHDPAGAGKEKRGFGVQGEGRKWFQGAASWARNEERASKPLFAWLPRLAEHAHLHLHGPHWHDGSTCKAARPITGLNRAC